MIWLLIILVIVNFIKYAKQAEKISITGWFFYANNKRNWIIVSILIAWPVIKLLAFGLLALIAYISRL